MGKYQRSYLTLLSGLKKRVLSILAPFFVISVLLIVVGTIGFHSYYNASRDDLREENTASRQSAISSWQENLLEKIHHLLTTDDFKYFIDSGPASLGLYEDSIKSFFNSLGPYVSGASIYKFSRHGSHKICDFGQKTDESIVLGVNYVGRSLNLKRGNHTCDIHLYLNTDQIRSSLSSYIRGKSYLTISVPLFDKVYDQYELQCSLSKPLNVGVRCNTAYLDGILNYFGVGMSAFILLIFLCFIISYRKIETSEATKEIAYSYDRKNPENSIDTGISELDFLERKRKEFLAMKQSNGALMHESKKPGTNALSTMQFIETILSEKPKKDESDEIILDAIKDSTSTISTSLSFLSTVQEAYRILQNENRLKTQSLNLTGLIPIAMIGTERISKQKNIKIRITKPLKTIYAEGNPEAVVSILSNLIINALQWCSRDSEITINILEGKACLVEVENTGSFIEKNTPVFEASYSRRKNGLGIGLALCHKLAQNMGGSICFESHFSQKASERKTKFVLSLPISQKTPSNSQSRELGTIFFPIDQMEEKVLATKLEALINKIRNIDVLVIDDEEINFLLIKSYIQNNDLKLHVKIHYASNYESAVEALENHVYDLVIVDIELGHIDSNGEDIIRKFKSTSSFIIHSNFKSKLSEIEKAAKPMQKGAFFDLLKQVIEKNED